MGGDIAQRPDPRNQTPAIPAKEHAKVDIKRPFHSPILLDPPPPSTHPSPAPRPAMQTRRPAQPGPHMNHNTGSKWLNSISEFLSKNFKMSVNCNNFNTSFNRQIRVGYLDCLTRLEHTKRVAQHHGSAHKVR